MGVLFILGVILVYSMVINALLRSGLAESAFYGAIEKYGRELSVKTAVDRFQMNERCCGAASYEDYFGKSWYIKKEWLLRRRNADERR